MKEIIEKLESELRDLEHELRIELPKEIQKAVAMGDLRENAEYAAALERQAFVKARVADLRQRLGELSSMSLDRIPKGKVAIGSSVTVLDMDSDEEITFHLVFPEVADTSKNMISVASPIGKSLVGHVEGDEIRVEIPSGVRNFEVVELQTIHDKEA